MRLLGEEVRIAAAIVCITAVWKLQRGEKLSDDDIKAGSYALADVYGLIDGRPIDKGHLILMYGLAHHVLLDSEQESIPQ